MTLQGQSFFAGMLLKASLVQDDTNSQMRPTKLDEVLGHCNITTPQIAECYDFVFHRAGRY